MKIEHTVPKLKCERCDHEWWPRKKEIRICPSCKTAYWDVPRIQEQRNRDKIGENYDTIF